MFIADVNLERRICCQLYTRRNVKLRRNFLYSERLRVYFFPVVIRGITGKFDSELTGIYIICLMASFPRIFFQRSGKLNFGSERGSEGIFFFSRIAHRNRIISRKYAGITQIIIYGKNNWCIEACIARYTIYTSWVLYFTRGILWNSIMRLWKIRVFFEIPLYRNTKFPRVFIRENAV